MIEPLPMIVSAPELAVLAGSGPDGMTIRTSFNLKNAADPLDVLLLARSPSQRRVLNETPGRRPPPSRPPFTQSGRSPHCVSATRPGHAQGVRRAPNGVILDTVRPEKNAARLRPRRRQPFPCLNNEPHDRRRARQPRSWSGWPK